MKGYLEWVLGLVARLWIRLFGSSAGLVLAYHSISDSPWIHAVPRAAFEAQVAWLSRAMTLAPLRRLQELAEGGSERTFRPLIALTFDDGYADWIETIVPVLKGYAVPATFFVTTSFRSVTSEPQTGLLPLMPEHVRLLSAAGHEIGSHGHTHRDLSSCTSEDCRFECETSKKILEELSDSSVRRLSYPKGRSSPEHDDILRQCGFVMACGGHGQTRKGTPLFRIPRLPVTKVLPLWRFKARVYRTLAWG